MNKTQRTELSQQQEKFFKVLRSEDGQPPPGIRNLGIKPHLWLKEVSYGRVIYEWPNDGSRDIEDERVFGGWIAALADHIVSMTMASALEDGEWFTTTELTTRMFRPMQGGIIRIEGRLVIVAAHRLCRSRLFSGERQTCRQSECCQGNSHAQ